MKYLKELLQFVKNVANDPRIPDSDKKILFDDDRFDCFTGGYHTGLDTHHWRNG